MSRRIIERLNKQATQDSIENADQVEWDALVHGSAIIEQGIADDAIAGTLDSFEVDEGNDFDNDEPGWAERAEREEEAAGETAEELDRRALILGDKYPFVIQGNQITYVERGTGVYEFCLSVSRSPDLVAAPYNKLPQAFEALSAQVLAGWLGRGATAWQTGWPGRMDDTLPGRSGSLPKSLPDLYTQIHGETGEWKWLRDDEIPEDAEEEQKDLGIDLIVCKGLGDFRTHALFLAGQCACGYDGVSGKGKSGDLNKDWIARWFGLPTNADLVRCLLLPRCLGGEASAIRIRAGMLYFDRLRLVLAGDSIDPANFGGNVRNSLQPYVELVKNGPI